MRVVIFVAGGAAAYWAYTGVRSGRWPPNSPILAGLAALQVAGAVMAIGSLILKP